MLTRGRQGATRRRPGPGEQREPPRPCGVRTPRAGHGAHRARRAPAGHSLVLLFRPAASSCLMSSGVSFGRSIVSVIFWILPLNANGVL